MFDGFEVSTVDADETTIFIRHKGNGPPLLLLHGFPETHAMWHSVAPMLGDAFTVICAVPLGWRATYRALKYRIACSRLAAYPRL
jgi:haloacetate dehalogenase